MADFEREAPVSDKSSSRCAGGEEAGGLTIHDCFAPQNAVDAERHAVLGRPIILSDKQVEDLSQEIAKSVVADLNIGPNHPAHELFQKAMNGHKLDDVIEKTNEAIWKTPDHPHVDLVVADGKDIPNAITKTISVIHTHSGRELAHDDVAILNPRRT